MPLPETTDTLSVSYWLKYVTQALEYIYNKKNQIIPFYYDDACLQPELHLNKLLDKLQLDYSPSVFSTAAAMFHRPKKYDPNTLDIPKDLQDKAYSLYYDILDIPLLSS